MTMRRCMSLLSFEGPQEMGNSTANGESSKLGPAGLGVSKQRSPRRELPASQTSVRVDTKPRGLELPHPEVIIQRIGDVRCHLEMCTETLRNLEATSMDALANDRPIAVGVSPVTIRTIAACLSELLKLEWVQPHRNSCHDLCKLLDCPQQPVLREAIHHTVEVLETTKLRFKSKELKRLRESLEALLGNSIDFSPSQNT